MSLSARFMNLARRIDHSSELNQVYRDFKSYYANNVSYPQDRKSILATYSIGGVLVITSFPLFIILSGASGNRLGLIILAAIFTPFMLPLLLGYFVREMGFIIHTDEPNTTLADLFNRGRPGFINRYALAIDGIKFGCILLVCGTVIAGSSYTLLAILDVFFPLSSPFIGAFIGGWVVALSLFGCYVVPFLLARYAHTGTLGEAFALSPTDYIDALLDRRYAIEFFIGVVVLVGVNFLINILISASLLFAALVAFPTAFVLLLQSMDHFARGYRKVVDITPDTSVPEDSYAVPFRGGDVVSPSRDRPILVLGESNAGRTEAIKLLIRQIERTADTPFVIFDYKNKYRGFYEDDDIIRISLKDSTHVWNLFREVETEDEFEDIGRVLFKQNEEQSREPIFSEAVRQLTVAALKYVHRERDDPTNEDLARFLEVSDAETMHEKLCEYEDLRAAASSIAPGAETQATSVFSHLQVTFQSILTGDFERDGDFSVREYMENPDGRTLILDFPIDQGERVKPVFRLFIDWAIRSALDDSEDESYFLLDEFQAIPGLEGIERLVNAGQDRGAYAILGLQSKSQLEASYGEARANSILSGLTQEILMRSGDEASLNYIQNRTGREYHRRLVQGPANVFDQSVTGREVLFNQVSTKERYGMSETELQQFQTGEAIVLVEDGWQHGQLYQLTEIEHILENSSDPHDTTEDDQTTANTTQYNRDAISEETTSETISEESNSSSPATGTND
jgi:hypothetical protein